MRALFRGGAHDPGLAAQTDDFPFLSLPGSLEVGLRVSNTEVKSKSSYTLASGDVPSLQLQPNVGTKSVRRTSRSR